MSENLNQGKRSLVLITVDCLRADHCGFYGYSRPTTPFLDSLSSESFVVPSAIVGGSPTYYSLPAILASRTPMAFGRDVVGLAPGEYTLATVLRESGYATSAFAASNPYISPRFGYDQGFELFSDFLHFQTPVDQSPVSPEAPVKSSARGKLNQSLKSLAGTMGLSSLYDELYFQYCMKIAPAVDRIDDLRSYPAADILVDGAQSWLVSIGPRPFFLWLHFMDPHSPYYPPDDAFHDLTGSKIDPARARYLNAFWNRSDLTPSRLAAKRSQIVQLYDAGIRWVDRQIARLVGSLRQSGRWDDCVFALTADHGEEFLEHGGRYHAPLRLSEETIRVPLLIRVPGAPGAKVPDFPMSHLHLAPTLLDSIGVPAPPSFQGQSLWMNLQRGIAWPHPAIVESAYGCTNPSIEKNRCVPRLLAVRDTRFKLVMRMESGATEELFDLEADPAELRPIRDGDAHEARKKLLLAARQHLEATVSREDTVLRLRARLRDLSGILG